MCCIGLMKLQVAIHNNMNEGTWAKVLEWEEVIGEGPPKLVSTLQILKMAS